MKKMYFRVWIGYDKSISVSQDEIGKVIQAVNEGRTTLVSGGLINGKYVSFIEPDVCKLMGYNEGYKLTAEDWVIIPKDKLSEHRMFLKSNMANNKPQIGKNSELSPPK